MTHDGFQFRVTLGGGYLKVDESIETTSLEGTISGAAGFFELYFGGTPAPGLTLGGFLAGVSAPGPSVEVEGIEFEGDNDTSLNLGSIGPYLDFYPNPNDGLHLLATLSYSQVTFNDGDGTVEEATSSGLGLGAGVGYDWLVGGEWYLGVLGRLTYAWTSHDTNGVTVNDNGLALGLLFSASYH
jgi:hypothetical protein